MAPCNCPSCNGRPLVWDSEIGQYMVACINSSCLTQAVMIAGPTREQAIRNWDQRANRIATVRQWTIFVTEPNQPTPTVVHMTGSLPDTGAKVAALPAAGFLVFPGHHTPLVLNPTTTITATTWTILANVPARTVPLVIHVNGSLSDARVKADGVPALGYLILPGHQLPSLWSISRPSVVCQPLAAQERRADYIGNAVDLIAIAVENEFSPENYAELYRAITTAEIRGEAAELGRLLFAILKTKSESIYH